MFEREKEVFEELNKRLQAEGIDLSIICVGGFVLSHYGMRTTHDIDGFFKTSYKIEKIIKDVGDQFGINTEDELWLNNSVQNLNAVPEEEICEILYQFSNLKVLIPPLLYIAGMKLASAREQDVKDVGDIIRKEAITDPDVFQREISRYGFNQVDESLLLEAFGKAYGMDWLEKYYIENEDKYSL